MIYHSDALRKMMAADPALVARVALWDSCGLYVRMYLCNLQLTLQRGAS